MWCLLPMELYLSIYIYQSILIIYSSLFHSLSLPLIPSLLPSPLLSSLSPLAYCVGLIATYTALMLMETAQPALLYLVPATLGSVLITALIRKEFVFFLTGRPYVSLSTHARMKLHIHVQRYTLQIGGIAICMSSICR